tara:strand:- start:332 stop:499 length:168 start_codon:yes stop_codon:yes gene_type:complete
VKLDPNRWSVVLAAAKILHMHYGKTLPIDYDLWLWWEISQFSKGEKRKFFDVYYE